MFKKWFPTARHFQLFPERTWLSTPWWPSDTLRVKQNGLLRILAVAQTEDLELAPLIENLAQENRGRYRRRLNELAKRIQSGTPIIAALEQVPDSISEQDLLMLRVGVSTGSTADFFQRLISTHSQQSKHQQNPRKNLSAYFFLLAVFYMLAANFIVTFIVPVLQQIHAEFDIDTNGLSLLLINLVDDWIGPLIPYGCLALFIAAMLSWSYRSRRIFRRLYRRFSMGVSSSLQGEVLGILSAVVHSQRPATAVVSVLANHHFDRKTRLQMQAVELQMDQGEDLWQSLSEQNIISPQESQTLQLLDKPASLSWCLREFSDRRIRSTNRVKGLKLRLIHPLLTLVFAVLVLVIAAAMLSFLTEMIHALANVV
jgi:type II secretory pathway component PulF